METKIKIALQAVGSEIVEDKIQNLDLSNMGAADVSLNINSGQIESVYREGSDLILDTVDGESLNVKGFFEPSEDGKKNRLFVSENNEIEFVDVSGLEANGALSISEISLTSVGNMPVAPAGIIFSSVSGAGAASIASIIAGSAGAVGAVAASGGGTDNARPMVAQTETVENNPPTISQNPNGTLTVSGLGTPGATVEITFPDGEKTTVTVGSDGTYSAESSVAQPDGEVSVVQTSASGTTSPDAVVEYTDDTAPLAPSLSMATNPDGTISVSGTGEPGALVTVTFPDGTMAMVTVGEDGTYSIDSSTAQPDGTVSVIQTDPAGNTSPMASQILDSLAPTAPTVDLTNGSPITGTAEPGSTVEVTDAAGNVIGTGTADPVTGVFSITPSPVPADGDVVSVTVSDPSGNTSPAATQTIDASAPAAPLVDATNGNPITGTAEPGSTVEVTDAAGNVIGTGTADPVTGAYSITPSPVPADGDVVSVTTTDPSGNTSPATTQTVDASVPTAPTVDPTNGNPITGTAEPGSTVEVTDAAGNVIGTGTADPVTGAYSITPSPVPADGDVVSVTATDPSGNMSPAISQTVDASAPAAPLVDATNGNPITGTAEPGSTVEVTDAAGNVIGTGTADPVTGVFSITPSPVPADGDVVSVTVTDPSGNTSPAATQTIDASAPAAPLVDATNGSPITGTAEPGSTVEVTDAAGNVIGTGTADPVTGAYSITPSPVPADGDVVSVTTTDPSGNTSPATTQTVDASVPTAPTVDPTNGNPITGTAEPGSTVEVTDAAGNVIGTGTADPVTGAYSITPSPVPADGDVVSVTTTDPAGNTSPATTQTIDASAPAAPLVDATNGSPITGTAEPGSTIEVTDAAGNVIGTGTADPVTGAYSITPSPVPADGDVVSVTATDPSGNMSPAISQTVDASAPAAPLVDPTDGNPITGTAEPGSTVEVTDAAGNVIGTGTADPVTGAYSITPSPVPADGDVVSVTATDPSGNTSPAISQTVDASAPAAPLVDPTDGNPITGTAEPGSTVEVTDAAGNVIGTGTADPVTGAYSITPSPVPADGDVVSVTTTDPAGNTSPATTQTVDASAPAVPTVDANTTNDTTPEITGTATLLAGEILEVVVDGVTYSQANGNLAIDADGNWSLTPATALSEGTYDVVATVTDATGNATSDASSNELVIDTTAPAVPTVNANSTNDTTPEVTGTATLVAGDVLEVVIDGVTYSQENGNLAIDADGNWSLTPATALSDGTYDVVATITDVAGNSTSDESSNELVIDASGPPAPTVDSTITRDTTPEITGAATLVAGDVLEVVVDGVTYSQEIGNLTVDADGNWSLTPATALSEGTYDVVATVTDAFGNATSDASTAELVIDTTAPVEPTPIIAGSSVMSGTGEPGSTVEIDINNDGTVDFTDTVDSTGNWNIDVSSSPLLTPPLGFVSEIDFRGRGISSGEFVEVTVTAIDDLSLYMLSFYQDGGTLATEAINAFFPGRGEISLQEVVALVGGIPGSVDNPVSGGEPLSISVHPDNSDFLIIRIPASISRVVHTDDTTAEAFTLTRLENPGDTSGTTINAVDVGDPSPGLFPIIEGFGAGTPQSEFITTVVPEIGETIRIDSLGNSTVGASDGITSTLIPITAAIRLIDPAGNEGSAVIVPVDVIPPEMAVVSTLNSGEISGTAERGALVTVDANGTEYTTTADPTSGVWTINPTAPDTFGDGEQFTVTVTDENENQSDAVRVTLVGSSTIDDLESNSTTISGGTGESDVLMLQEGSALNLDLTAIDNTIIVDIERINITGDSDNTLTVSAQDILDLSSRTDELVVLGNAGDTVNASGFVDTGEETVIDGQAYNVYENGGATLIVDQDVSVII